MNVFVEGKEFSNWQSVKKAKKKYEEESKTILSTRGSHKLKSNDDASISCVYSDMEFHCKAGEERKSQSKGYRQTSTYKMGCSIQVD